LHQSPSSNPVLPSDSERQAHLEGAMNSGLLDNREQPLDGPPKMAVQGAFCYDSHGFSNPTNTQITDYKSAVFNPSDHLRQGVGR
jgi:hypothetical protein